MPLSKSERNIIAMLSMCIGMAVKVRERYDIEHPNVARLKRIVEKIERSAHDGLQLWTGSISANDVAKMFLLLLEFENLTLPSEEHVSIWTSATLVLLSEAISKVKNPDRLRILEDLEHKVGKLHDYFDREGTRTDDYTKADNAVDVWNKLIDGQITIKKNSTSNQKLKVFMKRLTN
jgi:hypothetical protein